MEASVTFLCNWRYVSRLAVAAGAVVALSGCVAYDEYGNPIPGGYVEQGYAAPGYVEPGYVPGPVIAPSVVIGGGGYRPYYPYRGGYGGYGYRGGGYDRGGYHGGGRPQGAPPPRGNSGGFFPQRPPQQAAPPGGGGRGGGGHFPRGDGTEGRTSSGGEGPR
jgi:hypothetical protein